MEGAFYGCTNLNITADDAPNLSEVTSMANMFNGCSSLNSPAAFLFFQNKNTTFEPTIRMILPS